MRKLLVTAILVLTTGIATAAERKRITEIDTDGLADETQVMAPEAGDQHIALVWWIPVEFWQSLLARDPSLSDIQRKSMLEVMSGTSLLAVVQADLTTLGAFDFYQKQEVQENLALSFTAADGKRHTLMQMRPINPDLGIVLATFKPILGAAMGNLGNNMHFFVLDDRIEGSARLVDPYREGLIRIQLMKKNGDRMTSEIELPLNSLFVPRKCPNGKDAHVSWKYCPWSGERLED